MLFDGEFPGFVRGIGTGTEGNVIVTTANGEVATYHPVSHKMTEHAKGLNELHGVAGGPGGSIVVSFPLCAARRKP